MLSLKTITALTRHLVPLPLCTLPLNNIFVASRTMMLPVKKQRRRSAAGELIFCTAPISVMCEQREGGGILSIS